MKDDDNETFDEDSPDEKPRRKRKSKGYHGLGPLREVFTPQLGALRVMAIVCGGLAVLGFGSCALSILTNLLPDNAFLIGVIGIPAGLAGLIWCMNYLTLKVSVHAGGIVHAHRASEREIPWVDIENVWEVIRENHDQNGSHIGTFYEYTIDLRDRTKILYTSQRIHNIEKLGKILLEETTALLLPQARQKHQEGEEVAFYKLRIGREGLTYGKSRLRWKEIKGVKFVDGRITVKKKGKWHNWCSLTTSQIPNPQLFLALVDEIVGEDRDEPDESGE